jgi:hypothetical protein
MTWATSLVSEMAVGCVSNGVEERMDESVTNV